MTPPTKTNTTLEYLDPGTLLIETNVRSELHLTADFVASIKTHGVLQPVIAVRTEDGVRVRAGQRRTAAAVQAGLATIPVMVIDAKGSDADRITEQLTENIHRTGLTDSDTVAAVEQLALLGCSAAQITKRTRLPRTTVDQALLVSESGAREVFDTTDGLTLEHAAWLAEFEDDPAAYQRLLQTFTRSPSQARHEVERERLARRKRDAVAALLPTVQAQNPTAALYERNIWDDPKAKHLTDLVQPGSREQISAQDHASCPGHAFQLRANNYHQPSDGPILTHDSIDVQIIWLCTDFKANGHADRYARTDTPSKPDAGTDEAKEARRQTIALNRAGEAAKTVREEWLTAFTINGRGGKTLPSTWPLFMLDALDETHICSEEKRDGLPHVLALLGIKNLSSMAMTAKDAAHILLCTRLWAFERLASREVWRSRNHQDYLCALEDWGYTLSPAEKCGAGHITAEQAYEQLQEGS